MRKNSTYRKIIAVLLVIATCAISYLPAYSKTEKTFNVLYINSYHEGYKWSDDIKNTIEAEFSISKHEIIINKEYLDTQRKAYDNIEKYYSDFADVLKHKYGETDFDAIITSDDAAYNFVRGYCDFLPQEVPLFFCGLNNYKPSMNKENRIEVGITEYIDIKGTIEIIKKLSPKAKNIHYIVDHTLTGQKIEAKLLEEVEKYGDEFNFIEVTGKNINEIKSYVSKIPENDVILGTIFFCDNEGQYFPYDVGFNLIAESAKVPFYGLWEFHLGTGILGGSLIDGGYQGQEVANMVIAYFDSGEIEKIESILENTNSVRFDYNSMKKHAILSQNLPKNSEVINYSDIKKKNILLIHSYNNGFQWTDSIDEGLLEVIDEKGIKHEIYREYLDLKRQDNTIYLNVLGSIVYNKYKSKEIDIILVSDDGALDFVNTYLVDMANRLPLVFCGINNIEKTIAENDENQTGTFENVGIKETLDLINSLQPDVKDIYVINDTTVTGTANQKKLDAVVENYNNAIDFHYLVDMNMSEVQKKVSTLNENDAILLMSFNKDKSGSFFSYDESLETIYKSTNAPIYGFYDFYLGNGIVGGYITSGVEQGHAMAELAIMILEGTPVNSLKEFQYNTNKYMLDINELRKKDFKESGIPKDAIIINKSETVVDVYRKNPKIYNMLFIIIFLLLLLLIIIIKNLHNNVKKKKIIEKLIDIDGATGLYNHKYLSEVIEKGTEEYPVTACVADIDRLKSVNDEYGHIEGDKLIEGAANILKNTFEERGMVARSGGDEFVIILFNADLNEAKYYSDKIKAEIIRYNENQNREYLKISISIGFDTSIGNERLLEIVKRADKKMYIEKMSKRQ